MSTEMCVNCMAIAEMYLDADHRAESLDCQQFKAYRAEQFAKRL